MVRKKHAKAGDWRLFNDDPRYVDRFGLLLAVTAVAVATLALVDLTSGLESLVRDAGWFVVSLFVGATLLLALRSSGVSRRYWLIAGMLIGAGVLATLVAVTIDLVGGDTRTRIATASPVVWGVLSALAPVAVIRRLVHHRRASMRTLLGAVSAYLLITITYVFAFLTIDAATESHFFGEPEPTTSFMYYSLTTITTLGYGDLVTTSPLGRLVSTSEAVIGQVYLVTFVALIVGLLAGQRQQRTDSET